VRAPELAPLLEAARLGRALQGVVQRGLERGQRRGALGRALLGKLARGRRERGGFLGLGLAARGGLGLGRRRGRARGLFERLALLGLARLLPLEPFEKPRRFP